MKSSVNTHHRKNSIKVFCRFYPSKTSILRHIDSTFCIATKCRQVRKLRERKWLQILCKLLWIHRIKWDILILNSRRLHLVIFKALKNVESEIYNDRCWLFFCCFRPFVANFQELDKKKTSGTCNLILSLKSRRIKSANWMLQPSDFVTIKSN